MKNNIIKHIYRYKYGRIQVIGPACGGPFNWHVEIFPPSTYIWFGNQAFLAIRRTNLDIMNQPSMSFQIHLQALIGQRAQCIEVNFFIQLKFTAAWALYNVTTKNEL